MYASLPEHTTTPLWKLAAALSKSAVENHPDRQQLAFALATVHCREPPPAEEEAELIGVLRDLPLWERAGSGDRVALSQAEEVAWVVPSTIPIEALRVQKHCEALYLQEDSEEVLQLLQAIGLGFKPAALADLYPPGGCLLTEAEFYSNSHFISKLAPFLDLPELVSSLNHLLLVALPRLEQQTPTLRDDLRVAHMVPVGNGTLLPPCELVSPRIGALQTLCRYASLQSCFSCCYHFWMTVTECQWPR